MTAALTGCTFGSSIDNLMTPPTLSTEHEQIYKALTDAAGTAISLKYPKSGKYLSAFIVEDIDGDGVLELPSLISMRAPNLERSGEREHLIRWYALAADGSEHDKRFTYHNYLQGWYMELDPELVDRLCIVPEDTGRFAFCLWDRGYRAMNKLWTVHVLTGDDRSSVAATDGKFQLLKTDSVVYAAYIEARGEKLGITQEFLTDSFFLIQSDWKTGEM